MVQPEERFKVGACVASVFANEVETEDGKRLLRSVSLQRVYRDKDGEFKYTTNLKPNDVPKAVLALQKAYEHLTVRESSSRESELPAS